MSQAKKAKYFESLHKKGAPILLYNAWDSGSAVTIQGAGAKAIATSSWSVADAQGYEDGEQIPRELVEQIVARISATVDVPVTVDFEGGYSDDNKKLALNVSRLMDLGVIGINFEDQIVARGGLYSAKRQAGRIAVIRQVADQKALPFFINARTDVFLQGRCRADRYERRLNDLQLMLPRARRVFSSPALQTSRRLLKSPKRCSCPSMSRCQTECRPFPG